jgi:hypothetical protein
MKHIFIIVAILLYIICPLALAQDKITAAEPLNVHIKELRASPNQESSLILDIPIEVRLLDVSEDGNWFKVKIQYAFGPLNYSYVGWTRIPVTEVLSKREKLPSKIADLP